MDPAELDSLTYSEVRSIAKHLGITPRKQKKQALINAIIETKKIVSHNPEMDTYQNSSPSLSHSSFYSEYHGHKVEDLYHLLFSLRDQKPDGGLIYLAGDSSLDNKFWFTDSAAAVNGYEHIIDKPRMKKDISYWINCEIERRGLRSSLSAINCAVEESTVGGRSCCRLLPQDQFIRDNITENDILIVSVGGNDIALRPSVCTALNTLQLLCCSTTSCLQNSACSCGAPLPCDDYTFGCTTSFLSNLLAFPCGFGYFLHLFGTRIQSYIDRMTSKCRPKKIIICMIYYPDENAGGSWADFTLSTLGYNKEPRKLQTLIDKVFVNATENITIEGTEVIAVPLSAALNGKNTEDYAQRVEPSAAGGEKMAKLFMDRLMF